MTRSWSVLLSILMILTITGQASAVQLNHTISPSKPAPKDKIDFSVTVSNDETVPLTEIEVSVAFSFWNHVVLGTHSEDPGTKDKEASGDIAPGGKTYFHGILDTALEGIYELKSFTYNFSVYLIRKPGGVKEPGTTITIGNYTMLLTSHSTAKKTPGFDSLLSVLSLGILLIMVRRKPPK